jgi:hypothetical protein
MRVLPSCSTGIPGGNDGYCRLTRLWRGAAGRTTTATTYSGEHRYEATAPYILPQEIRAHRNHWPTEEFNLQPASVLGLLVPLRRAMSHLQALAAANTTNLADPVPLCGYAGRSGPCHSTNFG